MSHAPHHGTSAFHRGLDAPHSRYFASGTFGRLFPTLPPLAHRDKTEAHLRHGLEELGAKDGPMDAAGQGNPDNPAIPAGFVFFGQFIDHDITLDTTSSPERQNDPEGIVNFRTPTLELDSVYGSGPAVTPFFYTDGVRLLVDQEDGRQRLPRNSRRTALIGDPRNDENLLLSELHLGFLRFHNAVVDRLQDGGHVMPERLFEEAQRIVRWHYQWIVLHEYLPATVGQDVVDDIHDPCGGTGRRFYHWRHEPFIPVEFAAAAFRFGHTQVPPALKVNDVFTAGGQDRIPLFDRAELGDSDPDDLSGFGARGARRFVDWPLLVDVGGSDPQPSKRLDAVLSEALFDLPFETAGLRASLAVRNLLRGHAFGLPSGQALAHAMCVEPLAPADLADVAEWGFDRETPLWYYILREADVVENGERLGPVGGRIVAEVLLGLLQGDRKAFVRASPRWTPEHEPLGTTGDFGLADLLTFADG